MGNVEGGLGTNGDRFAAVLARLRAEIARAIDAAEEGADNETAYRQVGKVTEELRDGMTASGDRRNAIVARIKESGQLSLAALGGKIGVSKARAQEMMDKAKGRRT